MQEHLSAPHHKIRKDQRLVKGLFFYFLDFLHTQLIFPVKQREFATRIVLVILFSQDIVIISMHILGYFKLFVWKYSKTVSVPTKQSHGKLSNISKISTQTRITNFEANSVTEIQQVLPPKSFFFGGGIVRQVPGHYLKMLVILRD